MPETYAEQQVKVLMEELAEAQKQIKHLEGELERVQQDAYTYQMASGADHFGQPEEEEDKRS